MTTIEGQVRTIPGTEAALAVAGGHELVVDRPDGVAGGSGTGFNGGQLLALALAGCLANDLRYVSHEDGVRVADVRVDVALDVEHGRITQARLRLAAEVPKEQGGEARAAEIVRRAQEVSTVLAAVREGVVVEVTA